MWGATTMHLVLVAKTCKNRDMSWRFDLGKSLLEIFCEPSFGRNKAMRCVQQEIHIQTEVEAWSTRRWLWGLRNLVGIPGQCSPIIEDSPRVLEQAQTTNPWPNSKANEVKNPKPAKVEQMETTRLIQDVGIWVVQLLCVEDSLATPLPALVYHESWDLDLLTVCLCELHIISHPNGARHMNACAMAAIWHPNDINKWMSLPSIERMGITLCREHTYRYLCVPVSTNEHIYIYIYTW